MKDIYDLDVPMEEIEKWVAGYHFPYSSWDHERDEPGPKVLAWETEERIDFIEYLIQIIQIKLINLKYFF